VLKYCPGFCLQNGVLWCDHMYVNRGTVPSGDGTLHSRLCLEPVLLGGRCWQADSLGGLRWDAAVAMVITSVLEAWAAYCTDAALEWGGHFASNNNTRFTGQKLIIFFFLKLR